MSFTMVIIIMLLLIIAMVIAKFAGKFAMKVISILSIIIGSMSLYIKIKENNIGIQDISGLMNTCVNWTIDFCWSTAHKLANALPDIVGIFGSI